jgi:sphingolipid delta-4 desaturase
MVEGSAPASPVRYGFIDKFHYNRRRAILAKHPEIRDLMICDPSFKYVAVATALTQLCIGWLLRDASLVNVLAFAVCVGSLFACAISNATHELVHDAAWPGRPLWNKVLGNAVNWSLGWPMIGGYHRTHRYHHAFLGTNLDAKYPSLEEAASYDQNLWGRLRFIFTHPLNGGERWTKFVGEEPTPFAVWNYRTTWAFNVAYTLLVGWKAYLYILTSMWVNDCIYIQGSKNFADHWVDQDKAYACSYYGWINRINFNIGYHREHHDFPNIPGRYLPQVTQIARDYYSDPVNIADGLFGAVWAVLRAPPGQGLRRHANKLVVADVKQADDE